MGFVLNVEGECRICGKRALPGEKYCEKHKNYEDLDSEDKEKMMDEAEED